VDQSLITPQNATAIITTAAQVATLIVVIIYTVYTARMTSAARASADAANNTITEMKDAREQENAPYIVVYFDIPQNKHVIYLIIKNVGKSIATDVKLTFTPSLSSNVFRGINDVPLIKDGISSLPPNYELRTFFDGVINRFGNSAFPMTYTVEVSYTGGLVKDRKTNIQTLDLSMFYGLLQESEKGLNELVKALEDIAKHTDEINDTLEDVSESLASGVWIKNPVLATSELSGHSDTWQENIVAKLKEFTFLWTSAYSQESETLIDSTLSDLQNKLILICGQLLVILSKSPQAASKQVIEEVGSIASKLAELGSKRFYPDGGRSVDEFNTLGDSTAQVAEHLIGQISSDNNEEEVDW
jgi:hypothetical protein